MQAQNRVGQTLGNYRLVKLLGKGGHSEVYLAENIHLGVQTAIKVLKLYNMDDLEKEKFRSEAKFMTTLENPRIIKVFDYGIEMSQHGHGDGSTPYIVMEYTSLGTLRHLYPHGTPMPLLKVASYTKQIAEALQYAHDKNIIHLDVKPENMLVRKPDDVALSDFGIAVAGLNTSNLQLQQAEILRKIALGEQISVPGTAPYLAPERLQGHTQRASDQYSLAIVAYEWLTGKRPFEGSDLEICQKHEKQSPPSFYKTYTYIPQEVEQVVMKALSKSPSDRYKSVHDFALALESAILASQPAPPPPAFTANIPAKPSPNITSPLSVPTPPMPFTPLPPMQQQPAYNGLPPVSNNQTYNTTPQGGNANANSQWAGNTSQPQANNANPPWAGNTSQPQANNANPPWAGNTSQPQANNANPPWAGRTSQSLGGNAGSPWAGNAPAQQGQMQWQAQQGFGYQDVTVANVHPHMPTQQTKDFPALLEEFFEDPATRTKEMFIVDKHFRKTKRTRQFLLLGIPANILSALIVLIVDGFFVRLGLPFSAAVATIGAILSIFMLWRCTISVKKPIAIAFGVGVTLWWSYAALLVTASTDPVISFVGALLTFAISLGIHLRYINTRLRD